jgi:replicative DNA helicase
MSAAAFQAEKNSTMRPQSSNPLQKAAESSCRIIPTIQKIKIKSKYATRQLELQKISAEILETAKSHNLPIILGAQLGRGMGKKEVLRLDNLREAGDIENDAKLVLGIWNQAKEEADSKEGFFKNRLVDLELVILKNRNGASNQSIFLEFDKPLSTLREKSKGLT